jgi:hypothetical protein
MYSSFYYYLVRSNVFPFWAIALKQANKIYSFSTFSMYIHVSKLSFLPSYLAISSYFHFGPLLWNRPIKFIAFLHFLCTYTFLNCRSFRRTWQLVRLMECCWVLLFLISTDVMYVCNLYVVIGIACLWRYQTYWIRYYLLYLLVGEDVLYSILPPSSFKSVNVILPPFEACVCHLCSGAVTCQSSTFPPFFG